METLADYMGKEITGEKFNQLTKGLELVKLTNREEIHNGYKFEDGDNKDTVEFNSTGECQSGGIYFIDKQEIPKWIKYLPAGYMIWYRKVSIPNNARVYVGWCMVYKSDIITLEPRQKISEELLIELITNNDYNIDIYNGILTYISDLFNNPNEHYKTLLQMIIDKKRKIHDKEFWKQMFYKCLSNQNGSMFKTIIEMIIKEDIFNGAEWNLLLCRILHTQCDVKIISPVLDMIMQHYLYTINWTDVLETVLTCGTQDMMELMFNKIYQNHIQLDPLHWPTVFYERNEHDLDTIEFIIKKIVQYSLEFSSLDLEKILIDYCFEQQIKLIEFLIEKNNEYFKIYIDWNKIFTRINDKVCNTKIIQFLKTIMEPNMSNTISQ